MPGYARGGLNAQLPRRPLRHRRCGSHRGDSCAGTDVVAGTEATPARGPMWWQPPRRLLRGDRCGGDHRGDSFAGTGVVATTGAIPAPEPVQWRHNGAVPCLHRRGGVPGGSLSLCFSAQRFPEKFPSDHAHANSRLKLPQASDSAAAALVKARADLPMAQGKVCPRS